MEMKRALNREATLLAAPSMCLLKPGRMTAKTEMERKPVIQVPTF